MNENYKGWESFHLAIIELGQRLGQHVQTKPKNGYLQVDVYPAEGETADPILLAMADAVERATDFTCQLCGITPADEQASQSGWVMKLCSRCAAAEQGDALPAKDY